MSHLSPSLNQQFGLLILISRLLVGILIAVIVAVNGTHSCSICIPIVVGEHTCIRGYCVRIQVLVGVRVSLDWRVAIVTSPREANRRKQEHHDYDSIHSVSSSEVTSGRLARRGSSSNLPRSKLRLPEYGV